MAMWRHGPTTNRMSFATAYLECWCPEGSIRKSVYRLLTKLAEFRSGVYAVCYGKILLLQHRSLVDAVVLLIGR